jgi:hypothetical protein
MNPRKVQEQM